MAADLVEDQVIVDSGTNRMTRGQQALLAVSLRRLLHYLDLDLRGERGLTEDERALIEDLARWWAARTRSTHGSQCEGPRTHPAVRRV